MGVSIWLARVKCVRAGRCSVPTMDKPARKIKYGSENLIHRTACQQRGLQLTEETHAVQARHARVRRPGRRSQARSSGGDERGLDRHAGRPRRGARAIEDKQSGSPLPRHHRRGARVLHRRQPSGPRQADAGQEQRRRGTGNRVSSVPAPAAQFALPDRHRRSTARPPAPA